MLRSRLPEDPSRKNPDSEPEAPSWPNEAYLLAREARNADALKVTALVRKLQRITGHRKRDCALFILRHVETTSPYVWHLWREEEIDRIRELAVRYSTKEIAAKIGRSADAIKSICRRRGIRLREIKCGVFFSVHFIASRLHVRWQEVRYWIDQGWLEAKQVTVKGHTSYQISPEALYKCLRTHKKHLQKRNVGFNVALDVFEEYCFVPDHTLPVRESKRERAAFAAQMHEESEESKESNMEPFG